MRPALLLLGLALALPVQAEVYKWVDARGVVHYSNSTPPENVKASVVNGVARGGFLSAPPAEGCYTIRCQGELLEKRLARREAMEARYSAERAALTPPLPRGMTFRQYVSLVRGMSEGELLGIAGQPDLQSRDRAWSTYTYMPTAGDPFTTTVTLIRGRINEIDRVRKF
jgi:hypothetical protein